MHCSTSLTGDLGRFAFPLIALMLFAGVIEPVGAAEPDALRLHEIFADQAVLQCERPVRIWGWAKGGAEVTVEFAQQAARTKAAADGTWQVELKPLAASDQGGTLVVRSAETTLTVRDVLVGEVWLASGQSNMAMTVGDVARQLAEVDKQLAAADLPAIRFCRIGSGPADKPLLRLPANLAWTKCSPDTVRGFSAAAYFFASKLHAERKVPIGIIDSSRGGTPIEPFIPRDAFAGHPTLVREGELGDQNDLQGLTALPGGVFARDANWLPGRLFNSRLAPLAAYRVRGAIWYQGESNCGTNEDPRDYRHKMRALVSGWRKAFGDDKLPVYFVQLPGSGAGESWPYLREEQRLSLDVPHTGMAVTIDLLGGDIHPPNKVDVGHRLALWALANTYGQSIPYSGPLFTKAAPKDNTLVVHFEHACSGLMVAAKQGLAPPQATPDAALTAFEIADEAGRWHPATARINGPTVIVQSDNVRRPAAVRYGYRRSPDNCNLYNRAGLPASPFCSDPKLLSYPVK